MLRLGAVTILALLLSALPAHAYIWRCHQPNGQDIWTGQPKATDDCEEYDSIFNPGAAPPAAQSPPPQVVPVSTSLTVVVPFPPTVVVPPPPPTYAVPYPYYPYPYYYPYGPGVYVAPPAFVFRFGPRIVLGPHFRHHWR
jgi:hypothetical protein